MPSVESSGPSSSSLSVGETAAFFSLVLAAVGHRDRDEIARLARLTLLRWEVIQADLER